MHFNHTFSMNKARFLTANSWMSKTYNPFPSLFISTYHTTESMNTEGTKWEAFIFLSNHDGLCSVRIYILGLAKLYIPLKQTPHPTACGQYHCSTWHRQARESLEPLGQSRRNRPLVPHSHIPSTHTRHRRIYRTTYNGSEDIISVAAQ